MSLRTVDNSSDELEAFLDFLFEKTEGYVYAPTKLRTVGDAPDTWTQEFYHWPDQKQLLISYILSRTPTEEVYVSPSLFVSQEAKKENVLGSYVVWVEMDGRIPSDMGEAPDPSLKIRSSNEGHEHWYWKLGTFVNDRKVTERINRSLAYSLGADTSGWDSNQVLRPPNTLNHKRNRQVKLVEANDWTYDETRFGVVPEPPTASQVFNEGDMVDVMGIIARYLWTDEDLSLFRDRNVEEGDRSTRLMNLGHRCAEIGLTDREMYTILYTADKWWGKFHNRDDRDQRLNDIIVRARVKHPKGESLVVVSALPVMDALELIEANIELKWAIEDCLEDNGCLVLAAKPGIGKTRISLQAAISLALGVPFLKYDIPEKKRVGFFSLEMHAAGVQYFMKHMTQGYDRDTLEELRENLTIIPHGESYNVLDPTNSSVVQAIIEEKELDFVFFDTLGRITTKSLTSDDDVKVIFDWDSALRKKYSLATWYIHHNRKATAQNKQPKTQDDVYGSVYIAGSASDVYALWAKDTVNSDIQFINLKHRYSAQERPFGILSNDNLTFKQNNLIDFSNNLGHVEVNNGSGFTRATDIDDSNVGLTDQLEEPGDPNGGKPSEF